MNKQIKIIADRIKDLREFSDYSIEEFARLANIPLEDYVEYESGNTDIPIGRLYDIATALEIDPTIIITGDDNLSEKPCVVYEGNGMKVDRYDGYSFTSLAHTFLGRKMEPMIVTLEAGTEPELVIHTGQEFNYVLEGSIRVIVNDREYYLRKGDSIYFKADKPHAQMSMEGTSKFLTVIMED